MQLGEEVLKVLNKTYEPLMMHETRFKRYDLTFKTDEAGRPVLLFIGHKNKQGKIKGERFTRRLKVDESSNVTKDH